MDHPKCRQPSALYTACVIVMSFSQVLRTGMKHRHVGSHEMNIESSRSHSIMTVNCCVTSIDEASFDYGAPRFGALG